MLFIFNTLYSSHVTYFQGNRWERSNQQTCGSHQKEEFYSNELLSVHSSCGQAWKCMSMKLARILKSYYAHILCSCKYNVLRKEVLLLERNWPSNCQKFDFYLGGAIDILFVFLCLSLSCATTNLWSIWCFICTYHCVCVPVWEAWWIAWYSVLHGRILEKIWHKYLV